MTDRDGPRYAGERLQQRTGAFGRFLAYRLKRGAEYGLGFTISFLLVVAALWIFLWIESGITTEGALYALDLQVQGIIQSVLSPGMMRWIVYTTSLGNTESIVAGVIIASLLLIYFRHWWYFFGIVFASAGGGLVMQGLKHFFSRARPEEGLIDAGGYAFPSGHAFGSTVFIGYLIYLTWKLSRSDLLRAVVTTFGLLLILLIGSSRVFLNVHWLTDILGGFLAGFVWLIASIETIRYVELRHVRRRYLSEARPGQEEVADRPQQAPSEVDPRH